MTVAYDTITHKAGLEHVRSRPGMYVGDYLGNDYSSALMNMLREVVGNSVDEFANGHATLIKVGLNTTTNSITVGDNGRGIPFGPTTYTDAVTKQSFPIDKLHLATGVANTGAKYDKGDEKSFKFAIGMNGIGIKAVNALSDLFQVTSKRVDGIATIGYERGEPLSPVEQLATTAAVETPTGTSIRWKPDQTILKHKYDLAQIKRYLHEVAYLNAGLRIELVVDDGQTATYHEPNGLNALAAKLVADQPLMVDFPLFTGEEEKGSKFEIILKVLEGSSEITHAFVNGSAIEIASAPVAAARQAFGRAMMQLWKDYPNKAKKHDKLEIRPDDLRSGLLAIVKILHVDPAFDSQTKTKLVNTDIATTIQAQLPNLIKAHMLADPKAADRVFAQAIKMAEARAAAEKARNAVLKNSKVLNDTAPISLDIYTPPLKKNPGTNVLYMFEGQSASGSLIKAAKSRDPDTGQLYKDNVGVLALKGNVLNALETDLTKALANVELATFVKISGLDPANPSDLSKLNFDKFIIATDMDAGGAHICTLLVSFFLAHFPKVITEGKLFRVITPFFEVTDLKTKVKHFIYPDEDREVGVQRLGYKPEEVNKRYTIKRNKGLGEMSDEGNLTLVRQPRLQSFQTTDLETMLKLYTVFSGKDAVEARRDLIFKLGVVQDV